MNQLKQNDWFTCKICDAYMFHSTDFLPRFRKTDFLDDKSLILFDRKSNVVQKLCWNGVKWFFKGVWSESIPMFHFDMNLNMKIGWSTDKKAICSATIYCLWFKDQDQACRCKELPPHNAMNNMHVDNWNKWITLIDDCYIATTCDTKSSYL